MPPDLLDSFIIQSLHFPSVSLHFKYVPRTLILLYLWGAQSPASFQITLIAESPFLCDYFFPPDYTLIELTVSSLGQLCSWQKETSIFLYNKGLEVSFGWQNQEISLYSCNIPMVVAHTFGIKEFIKERITKIVRKECVLNPSVISWHYRVQRICLRFYPHSSQAISLALTPLFLSIPSNQLYSLISRKASSTMCGAKGLTLKGTEWDRSSRMIYLSLLYFIQ